MNELPQKVLNTRYSIVLLCIKDVFSENTQTVYTSVSSLSLLSVHMVCLSILYVNGEGKTDIV